MKKIACYFAFLILFFNSAAVLAATSPTAFLEQLSGRILTQLAQNKTRLSDPAVVNRLVTRYFLPYVDLNEMSGLVVGPRYWRGASAADKKAFNAAFLKLVVKTYSVALSAYDDDRVSFYPVGDISGRSRVQVKSVLVRRNGRRIPIVYSLIKRGNQWRVYDFSVENISVVQSYQAQFSSVLSQSGLRGLTDSLVQHNARQRG